MTGASPVFTASPDRDLLLFAHPVADRLRDAHRPLRVVLKRDGRPKHGHHRIPVNFSTVRPNRSLRRMPKSGRPPS
jgi:hypothetical protein